MMFEPVIDTLRSQITRDRSVLIAMMHGWTHADGCIEVDQRLRKAGLAARTLRIKGSSVFQSWVIYDAAPLDDQGTLLEIVLERGARITEREAVVKSDSFVLRMSSNISDTPLKKLWMERLISLFANGEVNFSPNRVRGEISAGERVMISCGGNKSHTLDITHVNPRNWGHEAFAYGWGFFEHGRIGWMCPDCSRNSGIFMASFK